MTKQQKFIQLLATEALFESLRNKLEMSPSMLVAIGYEVPIPLINDDASTMHHQVLEMTAWFFFRGPKPQWLPDYLDLD